MTTIYDTWEEAVSAYNNLCRELGVDVVPPDASTITVSCYPQSARLTQETLSGDSFGLLEIWERKHPRVSLMPVNGTQYALSSDVTYDRFVTSKSLEDLKVLCKNIEVPKFTLNIEGITHDGVKEAFALLTRRLISLYPKCYPVMLRLHPERMGSWVVQRKGESGDWTPDAYL